MSLLATVAPMTPPDAPQPPEMRVPTWLATMQLAGGLSITVLIVLYYMKSVRCDTFVRLVVCIMCSMYMAACGWGILQGVRQGVV